MISRWKSPTLTRRIAYTAHEALSHPCEDKGKGKTPDNVAPKPSNDPWAPIFDDISTDAPPIHSSRSNLPARFFTSRPSPKTFFSSNISRGNPGSGSGSRHRKYGTQASERNSYHSPTSSDKSERITAWDHIFEGVDSESSIGNFGPRCALASPALSSARRPKRSRPTMTAREISAFDKMFDMIFTAVSDKRRESFTTAAVQVQSTSRLQQNNTGEPEPSLSSDTEAFGSSVSSGPESPTSASEQVRLSPPGAAIDLFGRLRRQSNRIRQTSATTERLDRQKEEVELCETDQQLLEWTVREVFLGNHIHESALSSSSPSSSSSSSPSPSAQISDEIAHYLAHSTYPHILAHVMHTFRIKYSDPHTTLALFAHAKRRSIHSYVFGCTTPAYNELLETRWELDGALKGVEETLIEMRANGVRLDKATRAFVERVRREVGERFLSRKRSQPGPDREVWETLERVHTLVASRRKNDRGGKGGGDAGDSGRDTKLEAKKRHWNEEWKAEDKEAFNLDQDRLTLT